MITTRQEHIILDGVKAPFRILHISDIHFSRNTTHKQNQKLTETILTLVKKMPVPDVVAVTGDLVSRKISDCTIPDAIFLMKQLRKFAPVLFSLGNHETDLPAFQRVFLLEQLQKNQIFVLDNSSVTIQNLIFTGLTLPGSVYKNAGGYSHLKKITSNMIRSCAGNCPGSPCILLAHSPIGFPAYAGWGAKLVLSGHIHGGIIRIPGIGGILSPERKLFPKYTKGIYHFRNSCMQVSAGIGKLRIHNPAELVLMTLLPKEAE